MKRNRVGIALSAVGIHASIGSVYAWSVLTKPVMAEMGISLSSTTWAFSIAILFLGLSAAFLGKFRLKKPHMKTILIFVAIGAVEFVLIMLARVLLRRG